MMRSGHKVDPDAIDALLKKEIPNLYKEEGKKARRQVNEGQKLWTLGDGVNQF